MNAAVFKLERILDDARYEGFGVSRLPSSIDGCAVSRAWLPKRLAASWKPPRAEGRVRPFNDFPCVNLGEPAFSERAILALRPFLEGNGEVLPLATKSAERYFYYNVTTVADVLDLRQSKIQWFGGKLSGIRALKIDRFVFQESRLTDLTIFRIVEWPSRTFVTERFVERVHQNNLKGFNFIKVWPLPEGYHWDPLERAKSSATHAGGVEPSLKTQSIIVSLRLLKPPRPTAVERRAVRQIMDDVDALLARGTPNQSDVGALEGHEFTDGEARLFFTCPDTDALALVLMPWLELLKWPGGLYATKRYGTFTDPEASESIFFKL